VHVLLSCFPPTKLLSNVLRKSVFFFSFQIATKITVTKISSMLQVQRLTNVLRIFFLIDWTFFPLRLLFLSANVILLNIYKKKAVFFFSNQRKLVELIYSSVQSLHKYI
jgi:hypothetical protein